MRCKCETGQKAQKTYPKDDDNGNKSSRRSSVTDGGLGNEKQTKGDGATTAEEEETQKEQPKLGTRKTANPCFVASTTTGTTIECYDYATTRRLQEQRHNNAINSEVAAKAKRKKEYDITRAAVH